MNNEKKLVMELRWDPLLGEWIMISSVRSIRPWQQSSFCPFCPGAPETGYNWKALILENKFPMLIPHPPEPTKHYFYPTAKAVGRCYVVVETPIHDVDDISDLSVEDIEYVINLVVEKQREEEKNNYAEYFMWFRNKGKEIGVSLTHPHSQIYVMPFTPAKIERELSNAKKYWEENRKCLMCSILEVELDEKTRILHESNHWVAFMPFYSHWPFEAHLYPKKHVQLLTQLTKEELHDLACNLKIVLCGIKNIFRKPSPYIMVLHQAPLKNVYEFYHLHIEIYGIARDEDKLKYAAGIEMGGGSFTYDSLFEENVIKFKHSIEKCLQNFKPQNNC